MSVFSFIRHSLELVLYLNVEQSISFYWSHLSFSGLHRALFCFFFKIFHSRRLDPFINLNTCRTLWQRLTRQKRSISVLCTLVILHYARSCWSILRVVSVYCLYNFFLVMEWNSWTLCHVPYYLLFHLLLHISSCSFILCSHLIVTSS